MFELLSVLKSVEECKRDFIRLSNEANALAEGLYPLHQLSEVLRRVNLTDLAELVDPRFDTLCLFVSPTAKLERDVAERKLLKLMEKSSGILTEVDVITATLNKGEVETLFVEDGFGSSFSGLLRILNEEDLRIDDVVEEALSKRCKVIPIRDLEKTLGSRCAAIQKGVA